MIKSQPIDPSGQGGDLGGGGGSNKFSLFQTPGGAADGNNVAALGNPFVTPELSPDSSSATAPAAVENSVTPESTEDIPEETKKPIESKKTIDSKKSDSKEISKDPKASASNATPKAGDLNGKKDGKDSKGDLKGGYLNPNAKDGLGSKGSSGQGKNDAPPGKPGRQGQPSKPVEKVPEKPIAKSPEKPPAPKPDPVAIVPQNQSPKKKSPKCISNCDLDDYLGAEGSVRISQEIDKNGNVTAKLVKSSGNSEVDRKALEAIQNRKYESSDDGYRSNIRVTSQEEGSDFTRDQENRRRQEQGDRDAVARDRALQERPAREAERPGPSPQPVTPKPVVEPIIEPVVEPVPQPIPEPIAPEVRPAPVESPVPVPAPVAEPIAPEPVVEPTVPVPPEPVVESSAPEPATPVSPSP